MLKRDRRKRGCFGGGGGACFPSTVRVRVIFCRCRSLCGARECFVNRLSKSAAPPHRHQNNTILYYIAGEAIKKREDEVVNLDFSTRQWMIFKSCTVALFARVHWDFSSRGPEGV